jgi:hypothetical protein
MDPLQHPRLARAKARLEAAIREKEAAEDAYALAAVTVCGSRDAAAEFLGMSTRQLSRRLARAGVRARDIA